MKLLQPETVDELRRMLAEANVRQERVPPVHLGRLNRIVEHHPEDMTATVEAGLGLGELQRQLARVGQWLPVDPPFPDQTTVGQVLARNWSGPRRLGYGTIRDYVIGMKVALASGEVVKAGGKVVKNVAGYDLCKLFIGAQDSIGIIVEAAFKLRPIPEREVVLSARCGSLSEFLKMCVEVMSAPVEPVALDAHNLNGSPEEFELVMAVAGAAEDVEWQVKVAEKLGFNQAGSFRHEDLFWSGEPQPRTISVLPSRTIHKIEEVLPGRFVARLGNGVIYHREPRLQQPAQPGHRLTSRIKQAYDPNQILPQVPV